MSVLGAPPRARAVNTGPALALVLGTVVIVAARWGPDWPAQEFRAWSASHEGLTVWTSRWYGGQPLPGYSVLYPAFARTLGAGLTGLLATVTAARAAAHLAPAGRWRARGFHLSVAVALTQNLLIGQVPFLLGVAFGLFALSSLAASHRSAWVAVFAVGCSLASPLAGVFLLMTAPALALRYRWPRTTALSGAVAGVAISAIVGGAGGPFPCPWEALAGVAAFCALVMLTSAPSNRALRYFASWYLLVAAVVFVVPNPIGGNISRLGKLVALPLACHALIAVGRLARSKALVAILLAAAWPSVPFATSIARGATDPSQRPAYYRGLVRFLRSQDPGTGRVEIPFTREHWEALWVARSFPIARGWERQADLQYNGVLYHPLTARTYRSWLNDNSVSLVALPTVAIDYGGRAEARLLATPPSYLRPMWHDSNWQVWRVVDARPLVSGAARLTDLGPASLALAFRRAGTATVRIHASRLWHVTAGPGCVTSTAGGWLEVYAARPGRVTLDAGINTDLVTGTRHCVP